MDLLAALRSRQLTHQPELRLTACHLTEFPPEILDLADSLEFLNLSDNQISRLPDDVGRLKKLRIAFFNNNQFEEFPEVLAQCPNLAMVSFKGNRLQTVAETALSPTLRWLILTNNQLEVLPKSIGRLERLQKLMLAGNRLRSLPPELAHCANLELVRLAANQLTAFPDFLLDLPRLSWIALAGNPFCEAIAASRPAQVLPTLPWDQVEFGDVLGQGASGVIYKGRLKSPISAAIPTREVAVKLFKGEMTSDGSPLDEMQTCMAAGTHAHLITAIAQVTHAPNNQAGLVLPFVPDDYTNLGGPPSLESCTRDTYPADKRFPIATVVEIARGIAVAIAHLHQNGILHGDLYAHNILVNPQGHARIGDFGAASVYDPSDPTRGPGLERLESRAFGCLLEDLLDRGVVASEAEAQTAKNLQRLQADCMQPSSRLRPSFSRIGEILDAIAPTGDEQAR
ncbi:MAG: leucine-rich repeat-containing protein kinase family protein [Leptolyngbyaceae bacterium]|nr:leucine-rich repeat-containing protein kinase family protein [Leptolyngbyaceae bacterium]